jgi:hypothetical protein
MGIVELQKVTFSNSFLLKLGISADLKADGYFGPERERSRAHKFVRSAQESMERELLFVILKIQ